MAAGVLVASLLWNWRGSWSRQGAVVDADITLITSDRDDLACAWPREVDGRYRCEFQQPGQGWASASAPSDVLAPYFTVDRRMFLLPGLFQQPALKTRYDADPPANRARESLRRFVARCKLRLIGRANGFQVRWLRTAEWGAGTDAWVAKPITCRVADDQ